MTAQFVTTTMLRGVADKLSAKDREFALSMCATIENHNRLSEKQQYWIGVLYERATSDAADKPVNSEVDLGASLAGVIALFDKAASASKGNPFIVLDVADVGAIKLSLAGPNARFPGTVNVADKAAFGEGVFYGRITREGKFETRGTVNQALVNHLLRLSSDPVAVAAEYGKRTGACCFCARTLTHPASIAVGYGPICAERFNLPYGEQAVA
jgi:hypothetical protein